MKFWERFSINIFSASDIPDAGTIDRALRRGAALLDDATREEIRTLIISRQTASGGFPDRAGNCDLYYSLFGFFLAAALEVHSVIPGLKDYVQRTAQQPGIREPELYCLAILCASFFPDDPETRRIRLKIRKMQSNAAMMQQGYSRFLVLLSMLYLRDYSGAWRAMRWPDMENPVTAAARPCPVLAAELILEHVKSGLPGVKLWRMLKSYFVANAGPEQEPPGHSIQGRGGLLDKPGLTVSAGMSREKSGRTFSGNMHCDDKHRGDFPLIEFYRGNGGFAALTNAPAPDLLSTAVALFALQFTNYDLRLIRPDSMEYISGLYDGGGFRACEQDEVVDVEYTFYGLLGLGALERS
jgi:hypothetical protein